MKPVVGRVYRVHSRNVSVGICWTIGTSRIVVDGIDDTHGTFLGIREKFGSRYLTTEEGWAIEDLGPLPDGIPVVESLGMFDRRNGRPVAFDRPVSQGGRGWFYTDTDEADQEIFAKQRENKALKDYLTSLEVTR